MSIVTSGFGAELPTPVRRASAASSANAKTLIPAVLRPRAIRIASAWRHLFLNRRRHSQQKCRARGADLARVVCAVGVLIRARRGVGLPHVGLISAMSERSLHKLSYVRADNCSVGRAVLLMIKADL